MHKKGSSQETPLQAFHDQESLLPTLVDRISIINDDIVIDYKFPECVLKRRSHIKVDEGRCRAIHVHEGDRSKLYSSSYTVFLY